MLRLATGRFGRLSGRWITAGWITAGADPDELDSAVDDVVAREGPVPRLRE